MGFRLPDQPCKIDADLPSAFRPLQELENMVCSSWYVNILGVYPDLRGRGIGGEMLAPVSRAICCKTLGFRNFSGKMARIFSFFSLPISSASVLAGTS